MKRPSTKASVLAATLALASLCVSRGASFAQSTPPPLSAEGAEYAASLSRIVRRGFTVPVSVSRTEYATLSVAVVAVIGEDLRFRSLTIVRRSGNATFDQRVEAHLATLLAASAVLPEPPPGERARFVGPTLGLRFTPPRREVNAPSGGSNHILDNLGAGY